MTSSLNYQDVHLSEYLIKNNKLQLDSIKTNIENIKISYNNIFNSNYFIKYIEEFSNDINENIENFLKFFKSIDNSSSLNNINNYIKLYESLKKKIDNYFGKTINQNIQKIYEINENLRKNINDMIEFMPPSANNSSDSYINLKMEESCKESYKNENDSKYNDFYEDEGNKKYILDSEENKSIKCYEHVNEKGEYYCTHCEKIYCKNCNTKFLFNITDHKLIEVNEVIIEQEKEKTDFIESLVTMFKEYILKCNYIVENRKDEYIGELFKAKLQYPKIEKENEHIFKYQMEFLNKINQCENSLKGKNDTMMSINNNTISDYFSKNLMDNLNDILGNMILIDKNSLEEIDNHYYVNEKYIKKKNGDSHIEKDEGINEENEYEDNEDNEDNYNINNQLNNKFINIINLIKENKKYFDTKKINKILHNIIKIISKTLEIDKANIFLLFNDKRTFINHFIKGEEFSKLSPKNIRLKYKNEDFLYQYKLLIDFFLIKQCEIPKNYINNKYNFITPNLSLNTRRGTEIYNPPYGWFGVGLDMKGKYEINDDNWLNKKDKSSEWGIAYYFLPKNLKYDDTPNFLKEIIVKNKIIIDESFQIKFHYHNKRVNDKMQRIGKGYYLSPNINIAEKYTSYILFNNKKYKIVLMAKVLIKSIKEPYDGDFWIIPKKEYIRFYKILFKEFI